MFPRMSFDLDILQATRDGYLAGVRALIAEKASNLHRQEPDGIIPLHQAAFYGHVELTTRLLQSEAASISGKTAMNSLPGSARCSMTRFPITSRISPGNLTPSDDRFSLGRVLPGNRR